MQNSALVDLSVFILYMKMVLHFMRNKAHVKIFIHHTV